MFLPNDHLTDLAYSSPKADPSQTSKDDFLSMYAIYVIMST
jgi:hypothetical protein